MLKQINEIMRISDKGYVDDFTDIREILEHFLNYNMDTIKSILPPEQQVLDFADNVVRKLGDIDPQSDGIEYTEALQLSDLLGIMRHFELSFSDPDSVLLSYMKNLRNTICGIKPLPWTELFMAITVKSLFDFFCQKCNNYSEIYEKICTLALRYADFEISEITTIKKLLDGTYSGLIASWNPC